MDTSDYPRGVYDHATAFAHPERVWPTPVTGPRTPLPSHPAEAPGHLEGRHGTSGLSDAALRRVGGFLDEHLCERFTLADIASAACISRFHFARMFRLSLGQSPMEYVLGLRIALAKRMLARGDRKIVHIAAALGFCDQSHFTRSFRRLTGLSPQQYALKHASDISMQKSLTAEIRSTPTRRQ